MRYFFFMMALLSAVIKLEAQSLYDIYFPLLPQGTLKMASLRDKKILVASYDGHFINIDFNRKIDSIANQHPEIAVVKIPVTDFGDTQSGETLVDALGTFQNSFLSIPAPGYKSQVNQHPLLRWLTSVEYNRHYNRDINQRGSIFLIDGSGDFYAVFDASTPMIIIQKALDRKKP